MILRSRVHDCLFLNWALPVRGLPDPPRGLHYQRHRHEGEDWVFVSALLFRHEGLHLPSMPWARLSYPQLNLRFYTLDEDEVPSVLFHCMWVPPWVAPVAHWIARQNACTARLRFPRGAGEGREVSSWVARAGGELRLATKPGTPTVGVGPRLGSWEATVSYFRQRPRGYGMGPFGLRRVETSHVSISTLPIDAELERVDLLANSLPFEREWPALHSAWICPELTFDFELVPEKKGPLGRRLPAPG